VSIFDNSASKDVTTISATGSYSAKVVINDASGTPVSNKLVTFNVASPLATVSPTTALTDASGIATVRIYPTTGEAPGAAKLTAVANVSNVDVTGTTDFASLGGFATQATVTVSIKDLTTGLAVNGIGLSSRYRIDALVKDSSGAVVRSAIVSFGVASAIATVGQSSAITDATGVASVTVAPTSGADAGASTITATTVISGTAVNGTFSFASTGGLTADGIIVVSVTNASSGALATTITTTGSYLATAVVKNSAGIAVVGKLVNFSTGTGLATLGSTTALTDGTGTASVAISPTPGAASGAVSLFASTSVTAAAISSSYDFSSSGAGSSGATVVVGLKDVISTSTTNSIGLGSTYNVTAVVRDSFNALVANKIVSFSVSSGIATLAQATALTDSLGVATVVIAPATGTAAGAATITATAVIGGTNVNGTLDFSSSGGANVTPTIVVSLVLATPSTTNTIGTSGDKAQAVVRDASGTLLGNKLVTFSLNTTQAKLSSLTALTDSFGVATVNIASAIGSSAGAATLTGAAVVSGISINATQDFAYTGASIALSAITAGGVSIPAPATLTSGGATPLYLTATPATAVNVTITASCGSINGSSGSFGKTSSGAGIVDNLTYVAVQSDGTPCQGPVQINATTGTTSSPTLTITVDAPVASIVTYVGSTLTQMFIQGTGAATDSVLTFKVLTATGTPSQNTTVAFTIQNNPGGVVTDNTSAITDSAGLVTVKVSSGAKPGPVKIRAQIASGAYAESQNLTVASGPPSQRYVSVSVSTFNIEGQNIDGTPTTITVRLADRQGNPVQDGTIVNFTASGGQVPRSCATALVNGVSGCSVIWVSQNPRPTNGRVAVLAYAVGEKDYFDWDGSNTFDASKDLLLEMGDLYRDDNEDAVYSAGGITAGEFYLSLPVIAPVVKAPSTVSTNATGVTATVNCQAAGAPTPSAGGSTCARAPITGYGSLPTMVRQQVMLLNSSSHAAPVTTTTLTRTQIGFHVWSKDNPKLPMPAGTTVAAISASNPTACKVNNVAPATVGNVDPGTDPTIDLAGGLGSIIHTVLLSGCSLGDVVNITITSPSGAADITPIILP
jgi:hypothetical protein